MDLKNSCGSVFFTLPRLYFGTGSGSSFLIPLQNGIPPNEKVGFVKFWHGRCGGPRTDVWDLMNYGKLCMLILGPYSSVPGGNTTSVFSSSFLLKEIYRPLKAAWNLLAGIPSDLYIGSSAVVVLNLPWIRGDGPGLGWRKQEQHHTRSSSAWHECRPSG